MASRGSQEPQRGSCVKTGSRIPLRDGEVKDEPLTRLLRNP